MELDRSAIVKLDDIAAALGRHPQFHPWRKSTRVVYDTGMRGSPQVSVILPVYNQERCIEKNLLSLVGCLTLSAELIVVDDGSTDRSLEIIESVISRDFGNGLCRILVLHNQVPIYETACDNLGFINAAAEVCIEVQADMCVVEKGFDIKLVRALQDARVGTASGRGVHMFDLLVGRSGWARYPLQRLLARLRGGIGKGLLGRNAFETTDVSILNGDIFMGETCFRGPWALRSNDLRRLGFLDEDNFFLGNDDHDFNRRLFLLDHRQPVYVPMSVHSNEADGSTRKPREGLNKQVFDYLKANKKGSHEFWAFLKSYSPYCFTRRVDLVSGSSAGHIEGPMHSFGNGDREGGHIK